jgi:site-specific recombinase XerD
MDLETALSKYIVQLQADGRSPHTIGQYCRHVGLLGTWLRSHGNAAAVEQIDHETLAAFLASPAARERPDGETKQATSTNALRTSLRTFFRYCHEAGTASRTRRA